MLISDNSRVRKNYFLIAIRQLLGPTNDLQLRVFSFNRIPIISGQWEGVNEKLRGMKPHLMVKGILDPAGTNPGTAILANHLI